MRRLGTAAAAGYADGGGAGAPPPASTAGRWRNTPAAITPAQIAEHQFCLGIIHGLPPNLAHIAATQLRLRCLAENRREEDALAAWVSEVSLGRPVDPHGARVWMRAVLAVATAAAGGNL